MIEKEFGAYLRYLRDLRGLSITELSKRSAVSPSYISRLEHGGRKPPKPDVLKRLAPHLGIGYNELMLKAGHLVENEEDMRIEDPEMKQLIIGMTPQKKLLNRELDGLSEETIASIRQLVQNIKKDLVENCKKV